MGVREDQKEQRKKDILYAALEMFVTKGYAATKITDIAKQASMSTGLLFHYFESKEKLYEELVKIGLQGTVYPTLQQCESAIAYFEEFTVELFKLMESQPFVSKMFVLMAQAQKNNATPEAIRKIALKVDTIEKFVPIIEKGQKEGSIREGDAHALSGAFWCSIQGIAEQYAVHPESKLPDAEWIVDIVRGKMEILKNGI